MDFTGSLIYQLHTLPGYSWLLLPAAALLSLIAELPRKEMRSPWRMLCRALLAAWIALTLLVTLLNRSPGTTRAELTLFWSYGKPALRSEILLNYLLFLPYGFLLALLRPKTPWWKLALSGLLFSAAIELTQLTMQLGLFEFDDIFGNTVGCLLGTLLGKLTETLIHRINQKRPHGVR